MSTLLGLHRPGSTWLHRLPAGAKLLALLAAAMLTVVLQGPVPAVTGLVLAGAVLLSTRAPLGPTLRGLRGLAVLALLLGAWHAWQNGWPRAVEAVGDLGALVLLATAVTTATATDDLLDAVTVALRPFTRFGVRPDSVALAFSLMLRAVPGTLDLAAETRDAARARGLERDPRARLIPFVLRVVARARDTGEALHARGVGDPVD